MPSVATRSASNPVFHSRVARPVVYNGVPKERPIVAEIVQYIGPVKTKVFEGLGRTVHTKANKRLREVCEQYPNNSFKINWNWV